MDIGDLRDPTDRKFTSRCASAEGKSWTVAAFGRGPICASFEQKLASTFEFDSLLSQQDEEDLCKKNVWPWPKDVDVPFLELNNTTS